MGRDEPQWVDLIFVGVWLRDKVGWDDLIALVFRGGDDPICYLVEKVQDDSVFCWVLEHLKLR